MIWLPIGLGWIACAALAYVVLRAFMRADALLDWTVGDRRKAILFCLVLGGFALVASIVVYVALDDDRPARW